MVFTFSITPKKFLHTAFADHTDVAKFGFSSNGKTVVTAAGFSCQYDNQVVEVPFADFTPAIKIFVPSFYIDVQTAYKEHQFSFHQSNFFLRGPPVC
jgi:cephalosporin-C deacetylase-like acetyl esterase